MVLWSITQVDGNTKIVLVLPPQMLEMCVRMDVLRIEVLVCFMTTTISVGMVLKAATTAVKMATTSVGSPVCMDVMSEQVDVHTSPVQVKESSTR